tara:strand:+ start:72 stop:374 length:303 start_codon:yes stop_codon:yes gene_type:complete
MADKIAKSSNVSGELFDLSIPSFNNEFGFEYISYIMKYGISLPLEKYISELEMILSDDAANDKNDKRTKRLNFLNNCNYNEEIQNFFQLFVNYINGGGIR